ncbi:MAG: hypothetical protein ACT6FG_07985 [Methanosarcinaceae archaeon]
MQVKGCFNSNPVRDSTAIDPKKKEKIMFECGEPDGMQSYDG